MYPRIDVLFRMIREILNTSKLDDGKRLYEIIARVKSRAQANLVSAGHSTAVLRGASYSSPMAAFQDEMAGVGYYQFIEKLEKEFDSRKEELVKKLTALMTEILRPELLCVSYTGERISGYSNEAGKGSEGYPSYRGCRSFFKADVLRKEE